MHQFFFGGKTSPRFSLHVQHANWKYVCWHMWLIALRGQQFMVNDGRVGSFVWGCAHFVDPLHQIFPLWVAWQARLCWLTTLSFAFLWSAQSVSGCCDQCGGDDKLVTGVAGKLEYWYPLSWVNPIQAKFKPLSFLSLATRVGHLKLKTRRAMTKEGSNESQSKKRLSPQRTPHRYWEPHEFCNCPCKWKEVDLPLGQHRYFKL